MVVVLAEEAEAQDSHFPKDAPPRIMNVLSKWQCLLGASVWFRPHMMDNVGASKAAPWDGSGRRGLRRRAAGACGRRGSSAAPWQIALCPPSACWASPALCCACARLHSVIQSTVSPVASGCITSSGTAGRARIPGRPSSALAQLSSLATRLGPYGLCQQSAVPAPASPKLHL